MPSALKLICERGLGLGGRFMDAVQRHGFVHDQLALLRVGSKQDALDHLDDLWAAEWVCMYG